MPLEPWLTERIWPLEARWVDARYVADGTELAIAEMLAAMKSGNAVYERDVEITRRRIAQLRAGLSG